MTPAELVTILISDLVGSTGLETRVGPVRADELRREHFAVLREAIEDNDGREVKNTGDGLMVAFASPSSAVECATAMQQLMDRRNRSNDEHLHVRIGIGSGEATVEDGDYFGMPSIEAARLCDKAASDGILASAATRMLAGRSDGLVFDTVGELELKGIPEPVEAFEIPWMALGAKLSEVPLPGALRSVPAIAYVGRDGEREHLATLSAEARRGQRRAAFISGEPGIGKTRLAAHTALEAHGEGVTVLWGAAAEDLGAPYGAWIQALATYVDHAPEVVLTSVVERQGGELSRLVRSLGARVPDHPAPQETDPETERYLLFNAVAGLLETACDHGPVALVLDDLHWADKQTLALLRHVVTSLEHSPLLVLVTYRDSDLDTAHPLTALLADLRGSQGVERLGLTGLGMDEVVEIMTAAAGQDMDRKGIALAGEIAQETDGNPFFVAEILRHLIESGAMSQGAGGRWELSGSISELGIPQSVREVVARRVERLGDSTARILTVAAVIGRSFDVDLLGRLVDSGEDELLDALDEGVQSSVLVESSEVTGRYSFAHALINHTLYDQVGATRRARLHRRVAEGLEDLCGEDSDERLSELAFHWSRATTAAEPTKALQYAHRAGERALAELAPDEALRWFRQALELLDEQADSKIRCDLLIGLGEAQRQIGDFDFRQSFLAAAGIAGRIEDPERAARAALANNRGYASMFGFVDEDRVAAIRRAIELDDGEDQARRAQLLGLLSLELQFNGEHEVCRAIAEEALELARASGDQRTLAFVLRDHFHAHWAGDTIDLRRRISGELLELAKELGDPLLEGETELLVFNLHLEQGELEAADRHLRRAIEIAEELGQPGLRWHVQRTLSGFELARGRLEEASRWAETAAATGAEGEPDALMIYAAMVAATALESGREDEVVELLEQSAEDNPGLAAFSGALILAYARVGREDEARTLLAQWCQAGFDTISRDIAWTSGLALFVRPTAELGDSDAAAALRPLLLPLRGLYTTNGSLGFGSVDQCLGLLAVTEDDHDGADEYFAAAVEFETDAGMASSLALTQLWWARSLLARGGQERERWARSLLKAAIESSRAHGYAFYLSEAESLLAEAVSA